MGQGEDLHLVDFSGRSSRHLRENEPGNNNSYGSCARKAITQNRTTSAFVLPHRCFTISREMGTRTYKKPVLTPHFADPLIISGVQKLNMMPIRFDAARDQAEVRARRRCVGISAA